jgi:L-ascorbate metabolism protein UlaG (beta-lactamase superfamily)
MASKLNDTKFTWYGHSTWVIESPGGKRIAVDPWTNGNPACPDNMKQMGALDAMLVTHGHFDHIQDAITVARESRPNSIVGIFEIANYFERKGVPGVTGMNKGGTATVEGVKVTMLHADHSCGITDDDGSIIYGGEAVSYFLVMENCFRIYFSGDTAIFGDMRLYGEVFKPQMAVLPIGDHFTMDPRQAAYAAEMLGVKIVIPTHYGTFPVLTGTPERLRAELAARGYECEVLDTSPGGTIA